MDQQHLANLLTAAGIQDSLLQAYRQITLTFQGLLFAGATVLLSLVFGATSASTANAAALVLLVVVVLALLTLAQMVKVIGHRGNDVTNLQEAIVRAEQRIAPELRFFTAFKRAQHERRDILSLLGVPDYVPLTEPQIQELLGEGLRHTRRTVDRTVAWGIAVMWLALSASATWYLRHRGYL
jgi:hypothetical protein